MGMSATPSKKFWSKEPCWGALLSGTGLPLERREMAKGKEVVCSSAHPVWEAAAVHFTEIPRAFGLPRGGGASRDPFTLEGPGYKAFMLNFLAPTAPQDPRAKCHPTLPAPASHPCTELGPREIYASQSSQNLGSQRPGCVGSLRKGCSGGLGKARLAGLP